MLKIFTFVYEKFVESIFVDQRKGLFSSEQNLQKKHHNIKIDRKMSDMNSPFLF